MEGRSAILFLPRVATGDDAVAQLHHAGEDIGVGREGKAAELRDTGHHALAVGFRVTCELDEEPRERILFWLGQWLGNGIRQEHAENGPVEDEKTLG